MGINESINLKDKEFLKTFIDNEIKQHEDCANYNKTRADKKGFEESITRWRIESSYRCAYWMDLRFLIEYGETVAIDYGNDKTLRNTIDDIVVKALIPYLTFNVVLIRQCINDIAQFKSPNPPMRIEVALPLTAENGTIDLKEFEKEPTKQNVDSWISREQANLAVLLEQRQEYSRVLCILQEKYGCGIIYNPANFGDGAS